MKAAMEQQTLVPAAYTRVSSSSQATLDSVSLPDQRRRMAALADELDAGPLVEIYEDAGKSARKDDLSNRPAMRRLLDDAEAGRFNLLLVVDQDRIARNQFVWPMIAARLKAAGVTVRTPRGPVDFGDDVDVLVSMIGAWKAQREADDIYRRTKTGKVAKAREGLFSVWQAPIGYRWQRGEKRGKCGRPVICEEELPTVRLAYDLACKGKGTREISEELTRRRLFARTRRPWTPSMVRGLLKDARYKGVWTIKAPEAEESCQPQADLIPEAAVTEQVWARAQKALRYHKNRTRRKLLHHFLLGGVIYCAECGSKMVGRMVQDAPLLGYYSCCEKKANADRPCRDRYVPAEAIDGEVWGVIEEMVAHPEMVAVYMAQTQDRKLPEYHQERDRLRRAIEGLDSKLDRFIRLRADEEINAEELAEHREQIGGDREAWATRLAEIEQVIEDAELRERVAHAVTECLRGLGRLDAMTLEEKRWALQELDFKVIVACDDWRAPSKRRRYEIDVTWAGKPLVGKPHSQTRPALLQARHVDAD